MAEALAFCFSSEPQNGASLSSFSILSQNILYKHVFFSLPAVVEAIKKTKQKLCICRFEGFLFCLFVQYFEKRSDFLFVSMQSLCYLEQRRQ